MCVCVCNRDRVCEREEWSTSTVGIRLEDPPPLFQKSRPKTAGVSSIWKFPIFLVPNTRPPPHLVSLPIQTRFHSKQVATVFYYRS